MWEIKINVENNLSTRWNECEKIGINEKTTSPSFDSNACEKTSPPGESNVRNRSQCREKLHRQVKAIREIRINVENNLTTRWKECEKSASRKRKTSPPFDSNACGKTSPPGESNPRNQNQCKEKSPSQSNVRNRNACREKPHHLVKAIWEIRTNVENNFTARWKQCARLHRNFTKEGSKTSVSREASSTFHRKASKRSVSCKASYNFHRRRFQNDRFVRGFLEIKKKKVPKRAFRARLRQNFTKEASKMIVSCEASRKLHRKKLPKWSFRARLPTNFIENKASKTSVSRDASDNFHRKSFQKDRFVRGIFQIS